MRIKDFLFHELAYLLPLSALALVSVAIVSILLLSTDRGSARGLFDDSPPPEPTATATATTTSTPTATPTAPSTPAPFAIFLPAVLRVYQYPSLSNRVYIPVTLRDYSPVSPPAAGPASGFPQRSGIRGW